MLLYSFKSADLKDYQIPVSFLTIAVTMMLFITQK